MIRQTGMAGSVFLEDKGPAIGIVLFVSFISWCLFWPHGASIYIAVGSEAEPERYHKIKETYSEEVAELMLLDDDLYARSLSILEKQRLHCLMVEHLLDNNKSGMSMNMAARHEVLCNIFSDAAAMVDTYAARLSGESVLPSAFFQFVFYESEKEVNIGPFLTQVECAEIAARLLQVGEKVQSCEPHEEWHAPLLSPVA